MFLRLLEGVRYRLENWPSTNDATAGSVSPIYQVVESLAHQSPSPGQGEQGAGKLPQGSVLSTILFIIFIDDLLNQLDESTMVSAYAADLAIACRGANKELITVKLQAEENKVNRWSEDARLQLNTSKCEVAVFSND